MPGGSVVSRSFRLCTAKSIRRSANASWISLANRPFPPISARRRFCTASPVVRIGCSSRTREHAGLRSSMKRRVWISASGEPRVPTRNAGARSCGLSGGCMAVVMAASYYSRGPLGRSIRGNAPGAGHRDHMRRDGDGGARRARPRAGGGGAEPGARACALWRRGAGDRRPRPSGIPARAGPRRHGARRTRLRRPWRRGGKRRSRSDRRADRRQPVRQGDRDRAWPALRRGQSPGGARADRPPAWSGARLGSPSPICCCWSPAGIASASRSRASDGTFDSAARWTMPPARRSTRSRSCWGWAGPADRRWSGWRPPGMLGASPSHVRCWAAAAATSASPA